jgi:hypothetical protein
VGQKVLSKPSADSFAVGRRQKKEVEEEEEDRWYSLDQVPTTLHLVKKAPENIC